MAAEKSTGIGNNQELDLDASMKDSWETNGAVGDGKTFDNDLYGDEGEAEDKPDNGADDDFDFYADVVETYHREQRGPDECTYDEIKEKLATSETLQAKTEQEMKALTAKVGVLEQQNNALKKNISCLFKTAKMEVDRKDKELTRLRVRLETLAKQKEGTDMTAVAEPQKLSGDSTVSRQPVASLPDQEKPVNREMRPESGTGPASAGTFQRSSSPQRRDADRFHLEDRLRRTPHADRRRDELSSARNRDRERSPIRSPGSLLPESRYRGSERDRRRTWQPSPGRHGW